jgi:RHS repeat-associated protein
VVVTNSVGSIQSGSATLTVTTAGPTIYYYSEDDLGTSRAITDSSGNVCYDADFYPFGGERSYVNSCAQNYKFMGKERDAETGDDDFGARYYASRLGRWLSADWSAIPEAVPYANLSNPQTLSLYAMVHDDPETFADLDGHGESGFAIDPVGEGFDYGMGTESLGDDQDLDQGDEVATEFVANYEQRQHAATPPPAAQQQTAASQATQIPGAVKAAIMNSVNASNAPCPAGARCAGDTTGGYHEEGKLLARTRVVA